MRPPASESGHDLTFATRSIVVIAWSAFLAAALATMLCFAFVDPQALAAGDAPSWWTSRLRIYAMGFFLFWLTGAVAAALCWSLARPRGPGQ
jgi:hypothetical protein